MTARLINGAKYAISPLSAAVAITAISNANPAVASCVTPPVLGTPGLLTTGWEDINEIVVRAGTVVAATSFELEGVDTTSVADFPAGQSAGTFQAATGFVTIDQIDDIENPGGDQQYYGFQYVNDKTGRQRQTPTVKSAMSLNFTLDYDPNKQWFVDMQKYDKSGEIVIVRETLRSGDVLYHAGLLAFNKIPSRKKNEHQKVRASLAYISDPSRFAA